jgi:hypothetical protein
MLGEGKVSFGTTRAIDVYDAGVHAKPASR